MKRMYNDGKSPKQLVTIPRKMFARKLPFHHSSSDEKGIAIGILKRRFREDTSIAFENKVGFAKPSNEEVEQRDDVSNGGEGNLGPPARCS